MVPGDDVAGRNRPGRRGGTGLVAHPAGAGGGPAFPRRCLRSPRTPGPAPRVRGGARRERAARGSGCHPGPRGVLRGRWGGPSGPRPRLGGRERARAEGPGRGAVRPPRPWSSTWPPRCPRTRRCGHRSSRRRWSACFACARRWRRTGRLGSGSRATVVATGEGRTTSSDRTSRTAPAPEVVARDGRGWGGGHGALAGIGGAEASSTAQTGEPVGGSCASWQAGSRRLRRR